VVIAEDHDLMRSHLRTLLTNAGLCVVGETGDGAAVLPLVQHHRPDLLTLDLGLPGRSGLDVLRRLQSTDPAPRVIVFSMHAEPAYVHTAKRLGAAAYVRKGTGPQDLLTALDAVRGDG
jgi:DNA-binding NarL/FixJ family response regulator